MEKEGSCSYLTQVLCVIGITKWGHSQLRPRDPCSIGSDLRPCQELRDDEGKTCSSSGATTPRNAGEKGPSTTLPLPDEPECSTREAGSLFYGWGCWSQNLNMFPGPYNSRVWWELCKRTVNFLDFRHWQENPNCSRFMASRQGTHTELIQRQQLLWTAVCSLPLRYFQEGKNKNLPWPVCPSG